MTQVLQVEVDVDKAQMQVLIAAQGSAKVFYGLSGRWYMMALVSSADIFARGAGSNKIDKIWHFQSEAYYKSLLMAPEDKSTDKH